MEDIKKVWEDKFGPDTKDNEKVRERIPNITVHLKKLDISKIIVI